MGLDEITAGFRELIEGVLTEDESPYKREDELISKDHLGIIAAEQIRAGFLKEAEETLDRAIKKEVEVLKRAVEENIAEIIADEVEESGLAMCMPTLPVRIKAESHSNDWKLLWLAIGYANAGKLAEAQAYAESMGEDGFRSEAIRFIKEEAGLGADERRARNEKWIQSNEVVSMLRTAAELTGQGKFDDACGMARTAIARLEMWERPSVAKTYGAHVNEFYLARAYVDSDYTNPIGIRARELADAAIKIRAEKGERMPADFVKKPLPGAQANGARTKGTC